MHGKPQTQELTPIFILKFLSAISFGIFFSSLTLLMVQTFKLPTTMSASLVALFFGFHYSLPLLGGTIGDYLKNYKYLLMSGKVFQLSGALILIYAINHPKFVYLGLGCFLVDSMFNVVTQNMLLTNQFKQSEKNARQAAFLKGYMWMNLGGMSSFIISGAAYKFVGISSLLYISAACSLITLFHIYFFIGNSSSKISFKNNILLLSGITFVVYLVSMLLYNSHLTREAVLIIAGLFSVFLLCKAALGKYDQNSVNIIKFFVYMLLAVLFWTVYMLSPTFIALFIDNVVDTVVFGFQVPTQWVQIIDGVSILTTGALLSKYIESSNLGSNRKALFMIGISFAIFALFLLSLCLSTYTVGIKVSCWWIIGTLMALSIGEVFLSPASMALVGDYIPEKEQGLYMGISKMTMGVAVVLSGVLSEKLLIPAFSLNKATMINYHYASIALFLSIIVLIVGYVLFDRILNYRDNMVKAKL